MNYSSFPVKCFLFLTLMSCHRMATEQTYDQKDIGREMEDLLKNNLLKPWYPQSVDTLFGGFLSGFSFDFRPMENQEKMIVTQARHVWTNARAAMRYPEDERYLKNARHGFEFLQNKMWDAENGGFYWQVDRKGNPKGKGGKTAYGNAFGIYGLSAFYTASGDTSALNLAKKAFYWLEEHAHDSIHQGYYQHLTIEGDIIQRPEKTPAAFDLGYKDQNSSIHLLEAFTELYQVWPDALLADRTREMLYLIRDKIVTQKAYMNLFFLPDWTPVSFQDSSRQFIIGNHLIDHVSFGHDVETAYLMLEAQHVLDIDDQKTLDIAKKMVDHALAVGWDRENGGFYDEGYYFTNDTLTVTHHTMNWWAQAEGLNALLMMHHLFPEDENDYFRKFVTLWDYVKTNLIDMENGGWYEGGIDKQPEMKRLPKGHIWKATYHNYRAMENCVDRLNAMNEDL